MTLPTILLALWLAPAAIVGAVLVWLATRDDPEPEVDLSDDDRIDLWLLESDPTWVDRLTSPGGGA